MTGNNRMIVCRLFSINSTPFHFIEFTCDEVTRPELTFASYTWIYLFYSKSVRLGNSPHLIINVCILTAHHVHHANHVFQNIPFQFKKNTQITLL